MAIDGDRLPADELSCVAGEKHGHIGDVCRADEAAHGCTR
ncbi:uncharacterized protein METZ01_LOCUS356415, partial [marine metagenome]